MGSHCDICADLSRNEFKEEEYEMLEKTTVVSKHMNKNESDKIKKIPISMHLTLPDSNQQHESEKALSLSNIKISISDGCSSSPRRNSIQVPKDKRIVRSKTEGVCDVEDDEKTSNNPLVEPKRSKIAFSVSSADYDRKKWKVGDNLLVHSKTSGKWCKGEIVTIFKKQQEDMLEVYYTVKEPFDTLDRTKTLKRSSNELKVMKQAGQKNNCQQLDDHYDPATHLPMKFILDQKLLDICNDNDNTKQAAFISADMDNMKKINEKGHHIADNVIQAIGAIMSKWANNEGIFVYRNNAGGDEFGLIIMNRNKDKVKELANYLRKEIDDSTITTISMGVAMRNDDEMKDQWFARAEEALQTAKKEGRNRCCIADEVTTYIDMLLFNECKLNCF